MDLEELQQLHTRRRHLFRNNTSLSDCLHFALEDMLPLLGPWQTDDHLPAEAGDDGVIDQVAAVGSPDDPDARVTPLPSHSARKACTISLATTSVVAAPRCPNIPSHSSRKITAG